MEFISQIIFILTTGLFVYLIIRRVKKIIANIKLGKPIDCVRSKKQRWKNVLFIAFGQQKMFKKPIPALLHLFIYIGFILINLEVLEILLDGILGTHRIWIEPLGGYYAYLINFIEFLTLSVLLSCVFFLLRRNVLKLARFKKPEMMGWPALDANLILVVEILFMLAILGMNSADQILQERHIQPYRSTGFFFLSSIFTLFLSGLSTDLLIIFERTAWWGHIIGIFSFALYITYSKHLHIFMAFPTTYFGKLQPKGKMDNLPEITNEVNIMLGMPSEISTLPPEFHFGAKDVHDLNRKHLMDAYACTECGRCTAECPANLTGKRLSPRKIMMDVRDRMEELAYKKGGNNKTLLGDYITKEEINACTSCNACVEACPININPLDIIIELRRNLIMETSDAPSSWNIMFQNLETNAAPWTFGIQDRFNWANDDSS